MLGNFVVIHHTCLGLFTDIQTGDGEVEVDVTLGYVADVHDETEVGKGVHKELEMKKQ